MQTFTVVVIIESQHGEFGFPAVTGLTADQVISEKARITEDLSPGSTLAYLVELED